MMSILFKTSGNSALDIDRLNILVKQLIPRGPRSFKWRIVSPAGTVAFEFALLRVQCHSRHVTEIYKFSLKIIFK